MKILSEEEVESRLTYHVYESPAGGSLPYRMYLPEDLVPEERLPLMFQIHGMGSLGTDNRKQIRNGVPGILSYLEMRKMRMILIAPQAASRWVDTDFTQLSHRMNPVPTLEMRMLLELMEESLAALPSDPDRVYLSGISMGGFASWEVLQRRGELFASALIVCGGGDVSYAEQLKYIPVWCTHGDCDRAVLPERSRQMRDAIQTLGGIMILSEYVGREHDVWTETYSNMAYFDWLFSKRKSIREIPWPVL